eukprot:TRINITY_DN3873_c0_g1_i1.p1 TRINITY_DN3873_c0_g1~~TRINITY_DN3873_c0_g1_i1.p1  ORF type:complete len:192 (-),score=87.13 TRINITY_DN3873_c0_g1_i1:42-581(-)
MDNKRKSEDIEIREIEENVDDGNEIIIEKGFATASGKKIKINEESMEKAKQFLSKIQTEEVKDEKLLEIMKKEEKEIQEKLKEEENDERKDDDKEDKGDDKPNGEKVNLEKWDEEKIKNWLSTLDLQKDYASNIQEHKITGELISKEFKSKEDLKKYGITLFGDVKKILRARTELLETK